MKNEGRYEVRQLEERVALAFDAIDVLMACVVENDYHGNAERFYSELSDQGRGIIDRLARERAGVEQ